MIFSHLLNAIPKSIAMAAVLKAPASRDRTLEGVALVMSELPCSRKEMNSWPFKAK
jgi:hypothetical protein